MKLKPMIALAILTSQGLHAQREPVDTAVFNRIRKAELSGSQIPQLAYYLTDVTGPRLTASPGFQRASHWAVTTLKKWGLANAGLEPWGEFGKQWEIQDFSIKMTAPYNQLIAGYPEPWGANTDGSLKGEVIMLTPKQSRDTIFLKSHASSLKGKFLLNPGNPLSENDLTGPVFSRLSDSALANIGDTFMVSDSLLRSFPAFFKNAERVSQIKKDVGILGVVYTTMYSANGHILAQSNDGFKLTTHNTLPKISIGIEDAQKMKRLLQSGICVSLEVNIKGRFSTVDTKGYNVIAEIPGSDPQLKSQVVMLGAHLDSWQAATGATDNAAGCVVMMEAMRLLDSLHLTPKRTIRIALWGGEEQGLQGSYGYVRKHFRDGVTLKLKPEQASISAYFNLDNGSGKIRGIYTQNNTSVKPIFEQWLKPFYDLKATTVTTKNTGSTDHLAFDWAGIPG
ncbi:MAG TPA: M20/M25/M40 family metallo-hydrolase, partial [Mucilaginibacter sp.]